MPLVWAAGGVRKVCRDSIVPQTYEYMKQDDKALLMDVYRPDEPRPDSACVIFMFGDGFVEGSRNFWTEWMKSSVSTSTTRGL